MIAKSAPFSTTADSASAQVGESAGSTKTTIMLHLASVSHSSRQHSACLRHKKRPQEARIMRDRETSNVSERSRLLVLPARQECIGAVLLSTVTLYHPPHNFDHSRARSLCRHQGGNLCQQARLVSRAACIPAPHCPLKFFWVKARTRGRQAKTPQRAFDPSVLRERISHSILLQT